MFWDNFVYFCSQKGVSPNAVVEKIKKSSGSVTAWKKGTIPRETTLKKIADYFGVSVDELLYGEKEKSPTPEGAELDKETMELLEIWYSGDDADREFLLANARMLEARRKNNG